jgi:hypothetical protein
VSQSALESTGYDAVGIKDIVTEREVNVAGQSEIIAVTNYLTEYEKTIGIEVIAEQAIATFAILSTPKLDVVGQTLNPVEEMSPRELVDLIADNYDNLGEIEHDTDETVTVLDQSITQSRFVAQATLSGFPIALNLHVTEAVERGDDLLVTIGVYPQQFQTIEAANVRELTESVTANTELDTATANESDDSETSSTGDDSAENTSNTNESTEDESTESGLLGTGSTESGSNTNESTENDSEGTAIIPDSIQ